MIRLLISARDPAAAWNMAAIARAARADGRFEVHVYAADPAFNLLRNDGIAVGRFRSACVTDQTDYLASTLLAEAAELINTLQPDVVLTGLSRSGEGGIDEALLAVSKAPCAALQDFWGDVNDFFGSRADIYLVLDHQASKLTRQRYNVPTKVVGSPRHTAYDALNPAELRRTTRGRYGLGKQDVLIGLFSQPIWPDPGYVRTLAAFSAAVAEVITSGVIILRPHPKDPETAISQTREALETSGLRVILCAEDRVESCLAACDLICSPFSLCTLDALYLCRNAPFLPAGLIYLLFDPALRAMCRQSCGFDEMPLAKLGMALAPTCPDELPDALRTALSVSWRTRTYTLARSRLPASEGMATILDELHGLAVRGSLFRRLPDARSGGR